MTRNRAVDERRDEGLALPRTSLAWRRTSLAFLAMALVSLRTTLGSQAAGTLAESITAATVVIVAATAVGVLMVSRARTRGGAQTSRTRDGRVLLATSLAIVLLAVTELATAATGH